MALLILSAYLNCGEKKTEPHAEVEKNLRNFFSIACTNVTDHCGLWRAKQDSLIEMMTNSYLKQYRAKPDETSAAIIRERLKEMRIFLRIDHQGELVMLTISPDGQVGTNIGRYSPNKKKGLNTILAGRAQSQKKVHLTILSKSELKYAEDEKILYFNRDRRSAKDLVALYMERLQKLAPEY